MLLVAVGLAMDAAAVSVSCSLGLRPPRLRPVLAMAALFGLFQAAMPLAGWLVGLGMRRHVAAFDHWLAFLLLSLIGGRMIREAWRSRSCPEPVTRDRFPRTPALLGLAVATSIDALVVGLSLSFLGQSIFVPALLIGLVTFLISLAASWLGQRLGALIAREAEIAGGVVLVLIGLKILVEHLAGRAG